MGYPDQIDQHAVGLLWSFVIFVLSLCACIAARAMEPFKRDQLTFLSLVEPQCLNRMSGSQWVPCNADAVCTFRYHHLPLNTESSGSMLALAHIFAFYLFFKISDIFLLQRQITKPLLLVLWFAWLAG